ncbi:hypothetical protein [Aureimonas glaciei]|uniref:Uncharacterized protein n=1 Tax=Aureimonas glaciei TaxID=1776957 RepID=A0A917DCI7_9HYPH|nr:hypothetical protein [Aureimonas glaciei]GGD25944.1 hypothetical protein GCM10011335_31180 [Aureimonas glaciei]
MSEADEVWSKLRKTEQIFLRNLVAAPDDPGRILRVISCLARRLPYCATRRQIDRLAHAGIGLHAFGRLVETPPDGSDEKDGL